MITRIDHIAVVVESIERALVVFRDALGLAHADTQEIPDQAVRVAILPVGASAVELVEPIDPDSGVAKFLAARGEGAHHICLEVDDIEQTLAELRSRSVTLINDEPAVGAHGRVAFIHPRSTHGVMIELVERDRRGDIEPSAAR